MKKVKLGHLGMGNKVKAESNFTDAGAEVDPGSG